ncbi:MAG: DUF4258 domain-containing protein [Rhizobiaceae bacterium]|nr:DUF4258 domain-containing protein [Rhizobiaceae bacterium]MCV0405758.1 DUF4258 domain-containing protein [Rhizobiaceae bacterium]
MARKPLVLTAHAQDAIEERDLDPRWAERTAREPEWTAPDPRQPGVERRFRSIPDHGGRVLRVACYETPEEIRILTAFFDRDARRPP